MSNEFVGRGRGAKRKLDQNSSSTSKKSRGELQTPNLGPNAYVIFFTKIYFIYKKNP